MFNRCVTSDFSNAPKKRAVADAKARRPFLQAQRLAAEGYQVVATTIPTLLLPRGPSHVLWFMVAVVVGVAIQLVSNIRHWPDVCKERREVGTPLVANANSATAIARVSLRVLVVAAAQHTFPCMIFGCAAPAVSAFDLACPLSPKASTTLSVSASQANAANELYRPAFAATLPISDARAFRTAPHVNFQRREAAENVASEVDKIVARCRISPSHDTFPINGLWLEPRGVDSTVSGSCLIEKMPAASGSIPTSIPSRCSRWQTGKVPTPLELLVLPSGRQARRIVAHLARLAQQ